MSQRTTNFLLVGAIGCALPASIAGCGGEPAPLDAGRDAGSEDGGLADDAASDAGPPPRVPLDPEAPWPKFRGNALQDGRVAIDPVDDGSAPWIFETGKGVFSTPVVDAEGNVWVGSADRSFYAIAPDGTQRWAVRTGEIIDSSALLDDRGRVYVGSGDGFLYALERDTGEEVWRFQADDPSVNDAFIRWFEGNVAMGADGTLYAPNDNFCTYAIDRDTGERRWCFRTSDQTWSLPAVDSATGTLYLGNNFLLGQNVLAVDGTSGRRRWARNARGSVAASPMLTGQGADARVVVGSFDGFVRAYAAGSGTELWAFGARDHVYASPARLSDGTVIQPSADGTVYALDPEDGTVRWSFDTLEPIRSSPAVDAQDHVYVGSGEGRLFVIDPDGRLRWSMRLIDDARDDLNASVALGRRGAYVAGENGGVFFVPFDYCLRPVAESDARCRRGPDEDLPAEGAFLLATSRFGHPATVAPTRLDANEALALSLYVRRAGDTTLSLLDPESVEVTIDPPTEFRVDVSGDRRFLVITPATVYSADGAGMVHIEVSADYLEGFEREGLRFSGGTVAGTASVRIDATVQGGGAGALSLPVPAAPGEPAGIVELHRIAAPLPTILPSYNQIGFDSIHYLLGFVEGTSERVVVWGVGAAPSGAGGETEIDPASRVRFPLVLRYDAGLVTLVNDQRFDIEFNGFALPFESFRVSARTSASLDALESPAISARAICGDIPFYGSFLQGLGLCNPVTDVLLAFGGAELRSHAGGTQAAPAGTGSVSIAASGGAVVATFSGASLVAAEHNFGILLVDAATDTPLNVDYVAGTTTTTAGATIATVTLALPDPPPTGAVRAYAMVDAYPAARASLTLP
jgi:outer membrane protein assembly factor BamB